jgi:hypothetical protein
VVGVEGIFIGGAMAGVGVPVAFASALAPFVIEDIATAMWFGGAAVIGFGGAYLVGIGLDPKKYDFTQLAPVSVPDLDTLGLDVPPEAAWIFETGARFGAVCKAVLTTLERARGAAALDDLYATKLQIEHLIDLSPVFNKALEDMESLVDFMNSFVPQSGTFPPQTPKEAAISAQIIQKMEAWLPSIPDPVGPITWAEPASGAKLQSKMNRYGAGLYRGRVTNASVPAVCTR